MNFRIVIANMAKIIILDTSNLIARIADNKVKPINKPHIFAAVLFFMLKH